MDFKSMECSPSDDEPLLKRRKLNANETFFSFNQHPYYNTAVNNQQLIHHQMLQFQPMMPMQQQTDEEKTMVIQHKVKQKFDKLSQNDKEKVALLLNDKKFEQYMGFYGFVLSELEHVRKLIEFENEFNGNFSKKNNDNNDNNGNNNCTYNDNNHNNSVNNNEKAEKLNDHNIMDNNENIPHNNSNSKTDSENCIIKAKNCNNNNNQPTNDNNSNNKKDELPNNNKIKNSRSTKNHSIKTTWLHQFMQVKSKADDNINIQHKRLPLDIQKLVCPSKLKKDKQLRDAFFGVFNDYGTRYISQRMNKDEYESRFLFRLSLQQQLDKLQADFNKLKTEYDIENEKMKIDDKSLYISQINKLKENRNDNRKGYLIACDIFAFYPKRDHVFC